MDRDRKRRFDLRRLLAFPSLRAIGELAGAGPSEGELLFELSGQNPENRLFGRFDAEEVRSRLGRAGILPGLARLGYADPLLVLECGDPAEQRVCLYAGARSRDRLLLEARLSLGRFHPRKAIGAFTEESTFRMLLLHWLSVSDPDRPFSIARPRLPGQQRPGLGLLAPILALLRDVGRELGIDGVLDIPDHFHTALFYSRGFRFLEPEKEGRFQAIARDLQGAPLALVSEAIDFGCLCDAATAEPLPWDPAEQVLAVRGPLRRHFLSAGYRQARDRAFAEVRTAVDWDRYRAKIAERGASGNYP